MPSESGAWIIWLIVGILIAILLAGCLASQNQACPNQEPIIGAWLYYPRGAMGGATGDLILFIAKEEGRFDAVQNPRDIEPIPYEIWITGSWEKTGIYQYTLTGQSTSHDFSNDYQEIGAYDNTMIYDPDKDILSSMWPAGTFIRKSCIPVVPAGLNVSIPWD